MAPRAGAAGAGASEPGDARMASAYAAADRLVVAKTLLHCADISNPGKVWPVSKAWSDRVTLEFLLQGDREREAGLPVSPNMDRATTNQAKMSLGFIDFIVAPLFIALTNLLPEACQVCSEIDQNRTHWHSILNLALSESTTLGQDEKHASIRQWNRRNTAFNKIMTPSTKKKKSVVLIDAKGHNAAGGAKHAAARQRRLRRQSLMVLHDFVKSVSPKVGNRQAGGQAETGGAGAAAGGGGAPVLRRGKSHGQDDFNRAGRRTFG